MQHLVHGARWLRAPGRADHLGRDAGDRHIIRDGLDDHGARRDTGAMTNFDVAENLRARPDHDAPSYFGMAVAIFVAGATERHAVQQRDIVLDYRGLTDHESGGMVEKNAPPDFRGGVDVGLEHRRRAALEIERKVLAVLSPQPV